MTKYICALITVSTVNLILGGWRHAVIGCMLVTCYFIIVHDIAEIIYKKINNDKARGRR